jgi:uncharacterized membrane protein
MDMNRILEMIDAEAKATAGEVLVLTGGEFDSYGVVAVVRVLRDMNVRLLADAFLAQQNIEERLSWFDRNGFVEFMVTEGAIERIQTRHVHVANDFECAINSPMKDRAPANDPDALPYEWAEAAFDPQVRG